MNKKLIRIAAVIAVLSLLGGCSSERFMNLSIFIRNFNTVTEADELSFEDFRAETDDGNTSCYTFFEKDNPQILLKLLCSEDNIINEIRILIPKTDEKGKEVSLTSEAVNLFLRVCLDSVRAFTYLDKEAAEGIFREMCLYEKSAYENKGELTKEKDRFYFIYLSTSLGSELIVYNTYLKEIEKTEKPESRPIFGNTANTRTETVALE